MHSALSFPFNDDQISQARDLVKQGDYPGMNRYRIWGAAPRGAGGHKILCLCFWATCLACVSFVNRALASEDTRSPRSADAGAGRRLFVGDPDGTEVRLCIPSDLRYSFLPDNYSVTFLLTPLTDGTVRFVRKGDVLGLVHVERVRVARFRSDTLWGESLKRKRASAAGRELGGFVFEDAFLLDGPQMFIAASVSYPVNIIIYFRNGDVATRERRQMQLLSVASSVSAFLNAKECD